VKLRRSKAERDDVAEPATPLDAGQLAHMFATPSWLRDFGMLAWFLVGVGVLLFGLVWFLGQISTIVGPVIAAAIVAAVTAPWVTALSRHMPRAAAAGLVLLGLILALAVVGLMVVGGIIANSAEITAALHKGADTISGWAQDLGVGASGASDATNDVNAAVPDIGRTLLEGVAGGIEGLASFAFFVSFFLFSTFFLLKDGRVFRRFIDRHLGIPQPVATLITGNTLASLRRYFFGLTIVALFNGAVIGGGAWLLGVPLAGTIFVVTVVTAYIPFVGAFVSGTFTVIIALATEGTATAVVMLVLVLLAQGILQQIVQPIAFGATLDLNPLVVLIVTIAAGGLFGMVGLVLAAPITSAGVHIGRDLARARAAADSAATGAAPPPEPGGPPLAGIAES
jgi:predicted PurR-regulated permease PerM